MERIGTPSPTDLLTPDEVAGLLRCSGHHVRRMVVSGVWPAVRIGRRYRLSRTLVDSLLRPLTPVSAPAV